MGARGEMALTLRERNGLLMLLCGGWVGSELLLALTLREMVYLDKACRNTPTQPHLLNHEAYGKGQRIAHVVT